VLFAKYNYNYEVEEDEMGGVNWGEEECIWVIGRKETTRKTKMCVGE
jgi:hypothetical protein